MRYSAYHNRIVEVCSNSLTFTEIETRLGLTSPNRGLRRYIKQNSIPIPKYEGQKAAVKFSQKSRKRIEIHDLKQNSTITTGAIKKFLIRNNLKQERCEKCGWQEKRPSDSKTPIHLHHKNGDSSDNRLLNLEILCPNCHSLTENYAGKNKISTRRNKDFLERKIFYKV